MLVGKIETWVVSSGVEGVTGDGEREAVVVREGEEEVMIENEQGRERREEERENDCNARLLTPSAPQFSPLKPRVVCQFLRIHSASDALTVLKCSPNAKVPRANTGYLLGH
jgi:hypothetical protein